MLVRLNIGCGEQVLEGVDVAIDVKPHSAATMLADAQHLPFIGEVFDSVVSFETLEHIPNVLLALGEVRRVMKRTGSFLFSVPNAMHIGVIVRWLLGKDFIVSWDHINCWRKVEIQNILAKTKLKVDDISFVDTHYHQKKRVLRFLPNRLSKRSILVLCSKS
ncbi:class I SAM-dependent methyltransferase [Candidatus Bathyarchaeota archaeon]|nr:class I SAM-dependent methyltransferase [Candidatus Bathyarchaeota archaeon]